MNEYNHYRRPELQRVLPSLRNVPSLHTYRTSTTSFPDAPVRIIQTIPTEESCPVTIIGYSENLPEGISGDILEDNLIVIQREEIHKNYFACLEALIPWCIIIAIITMMSLYFYGIFDTKSMVGN